jgi:hypothetical protein
VAIRVVKTGRFFDVAQADADTRAAVDEIGRAVAIDAMRNWNLLLDSRIRVNQFRYMSGNRIEPRGSSWVVHDDIAKPYGPWLEGVGSRNAPVTRFEGYHALAEATELTDRAAFGIAEEHVVRLVDQLNEPT